MIVRSKEELVFYFKIFKFWGILNFVEKRRAISDEDLHHQYHRITTNMTPSAFSTYFCKTQPYYYFIQPFKRKNASRKEIEVQILYSQIEGEKKKLNVVVGADENLRCELN